ncbi:Family of unknown function (DUF572) [Abeliophyllum distichum]|uniref:Uncharacterized protein n=1 Tax=Abeliophyllum distichum TaxID=126358 RepID=A0ABD1TWJ9_9LAMI
MATYKILPSQSDVPKISKEKPKKFMVRRKALPFKVHCEYCGFCMDKGNKYDAVKEEVGWESLFEIPIWRFKFNCYSCSAPFFIKTDPGRYDFILESSRVKSGVTSMPLNPNV